MSDAAPSPEVARAFTGALHVLGLSIDRNRAGLQLLRDRLLHAALSPALGAACAARLPAVQYQLHCPACWTRLPPGAEPEFVGCPSCGHGMFPRAIEAPHRCQRCASVSDGPPARLAHAALDRSGAVGPPCHGEHVPAPYLDLDVIARGAELVALQGAARAPLPPHLAEALWAEPLVWDRPGELRLFLDPGFAEAHPGLRDRLASVPVRAAR